MARVAFTRHLHRFFPALGEHAHLDIEAGDIATLITQLDQRFPGLAGYLVDDRNALRKHVNVFVDGKPVDDRQGLSDAIGATSSVHIMQALSGG